jgi:REP-associated tyrosine transposase
MSQSFAQVYLHIVFSTKDRRTFLQDHAIRNELHKYLAGTCNNLDSQTLQVGGAKDHVHVLCRLGRSISIAELVRSLKLESSKWIKSKATELTDFYWQSGYGAFSVSPGHVNVLGEYISNQEKHHTRESYQQEFIRLLKKYGIQWDERYIWD